MTTLILDTETTGMAMRECIQLCAADATITHDGCEFGKLQIDYYLPNSAIEYGALATHGMTRSYLESKGAIRQYEKLARFQVEPDYIIAHNVDYDADVLGFTTAKRIDTLAIARIVYKDCDSHKLGALGWMLFPDFMATASLHDASTDVELLKRVLADICAKEEINTIEELYGFSNACRIPQVMPFGKHRGESFADLPISYLNWVISKDDIDKYVREACSKEIARRYPGRK